MTSLRSRRLEALLGATIADATYAQVAALANATVAEDYDLDFKSELYSQIDKGKRALAQDVAALANAAGGVIILGFNEDDQARAVLPLAEVALSDDEHNRMLQIIHAQVMPLPTVDIRAVENPAALDVGFYLISVLRTPEAPHAVRINDTLRYPRRTGRITTYLSEPEIAQAYRQRFAGLQSRLDAAEEHERYLLNRLDDEGRVFLVLTLVPDVDGYAPVTAQSYRDFDTSVIGQNPLIATTDKTFKRTMVRSDRFIADGTFHAAEDLGDRAASLRMLSCILHSSGAGSIAVPVARREGWRAALQDQRLVEAVMSGLPFLARHARDRAATGGNSSLRARLSPNKDGFATDLMRLDNYGYKNKIGKLPLIHEATVTAVGDIDDLAAGGPAMVATAHVLATSLMQEFGIPEVQQITKDGTLRLESWPPSFRPALTAWAGQASVALTSSTTTQVTD
jgi:Putative DNA-binding domain